MAKDFFKRLDARIREKDTLLCVGLDPQDIALAAGGRPERDKTYSALVKWAERIISETGEYAACFKPNIAFYEACGPEGLEALKGIIEMIPKEIPVIIDAKRSDIGSTARAYARALFDGLKADAVTLNPYLGKESVLPFLEYKDKGLFILCRTSNPGSKVLQELKVCDEAGIEEYYLRVAREASSWSSQIGLVVAGNDYAALARVREAVPEVWILAPGIGEQGGKISEALAAGLRSDGRGMLLNISRGISGADSPHRAAEQAVEEMRRAAEQVMQKMSRSSGRGVAKVRQAERHSRQKGAGLNKNTETARKTRAGKANKILEPEKRRLIGELIRADCFQLGKFTLKSGLTSPFYLDLRLIISQPKLMQQVAGAYCSIIKDLRFDRLAGIPFAALPIASIISLMLEKPLIFPRLEVKQHGTKKQIEGKFRNGEQVLLVDDLISTGASKLEAVNILREQGLRVGELVVLVERGLNCREELKQQGIALHAYLHIYDFLAVALELQKLTTAGYEEIMRFLGS